MRSAAILAAVVAIALAAHAGGSHSSDSHNLGGYHSGSHSSSRHSNNFHGRSRTFGGSEHGRYASGSYQDAIAHPRLCRCPTGFSRADQTF